MIDLSNFKTFDFSEGVPYISITSNGITFNKSVIMKMKYPAYVKLLINETEKQIAVQACGNMMINQCNFTKKSQMVFCLFDGTQKI